MNPITRTEEHVKISNAANFQCSSAKAVLNLHISSSEKLVNPE